MLFLDDIVLVEETKGVITKLECGGESWNRENLDQVDARMSI